MPHTATPSINLNDQANLTPAFQNWLQIVLQGVIDHQINTEYSRTLKQLQDIELEIQAKICSLGRLQSKLQGLHESTIEILHAFYPLCKTSEKTPDKDKLVLLSQLKSNMYDLQKIETFIKNYDDIIDFINMATQNNYSFTSKKNIRNKTANIEDHQKIAPVLNPKNGNGIFIYDSYMCTLRDKLMILAQYKQHGTRLPEDKLKNLIMKDALAIISLKNLLQDYINKDSKLSISKRIIYFAQQQYAHYIKAFNFQHAILKRRYQLECRYTRGIQHPNTIAKLKILFEEDILANNQNNLDNPNNNPLIHHVSKILKFLAASFASCTSIQMSEEHMHPNQDYPMSMLTEPLLPEKNLHLNFN